MKNKLIYTFSLIIVAGCQHVPSKFTSTPEMARHSKHSYHDQYHGAIEASQPLLQQDVLSPIAEPISFNRFQAKTFSDAILNAQPFTARTFADRQKGMLTQAYVPHQDLWTHIRQQLSFTTLEHPRIQKQRNLFLKQTDYIESVTERAAPYLQLITQEIEQKKLPMELALLPIIESKFNPHASSPGGAVGIWQFISGTARHYGLKQNPWYDGRRDVYASTKAALNYLRDLQRTFDGDWLLALAAYNVGEGYVKRAIAQNRREGKATDYWSLNLPKETRDYVPNLLALAQLLKEPNKYGVEWPSLLRQEPIEVVHVPMGLDLIKTVSLSGMTTDKFYQLNSGFKRRSGIPASSYQILLPKPHAEQFKQQLGLLQKPALANRSTVVMNTWQSYLAE